MTETEKGKPEMFVFFSGLGKKTPPEWIHDKCIVTLSQFREIV